MLAAGLFESFPPGSFSARTARTFMALANRVGLHASLSKAQSR